VYASSLFCRAMHMLWFKVCPSVRHKQVFCRNSWMDRALAVRRRGFLRLILHCVTRDFWYRQNDGSLLFSWTFYVPRFEL